MKKILIGTASFLIAATTAMPAYSQDVSVSTSIDYVTDYVFRGVSLADSAIQPGVEVAVRSVVAEFGFGSTERFKLCLLDGLGLLERLAASNFDLRKDLFIGEAVQTRMYLRLLPLILQHVEVFDFADKVPNGFHRLTDILVSVW